jgi:hypothetical protein
MKKTTEKSSSPENNQSFGSKSFLENYRHSLASLEIPAKLPVPKNYFAGLHSPKMPKLTRTSESPKVLAKNRRSIAAS